MEAVADPQAVGSQSDIVFHDVDIVGTGIDFSAPGTTFTINRPGLYLVEWSVNLADNNTVYAVIGTMEGGDTASAISSSAMTGNVSSGALIMVDTVPYEISLRNFFDPIVLGIQYSANFTAASIRILRFADEPNA